MTDDIKTCFDCEHCRELYRRYQAGNRWRYIAVPAYVHCAAYKKPTLPFYAENCSKFESR